MKSSAKFVKPLTEEQRERLKEILKLHALHEKRMRAHAILLSDQHYSIDQIADIYQVDRQLVSDWLDCWNDRQFEGLEGDPKAYLIREGGVSERLPTMVIGDVSGTGYPSPPLEIHPPRHDQFTPGIPGVVYPDLSLDSSRDDENIEQKPFLLISRLSPLTAEEAPELHQKARDFVNRLRKMNERPPKIITLKDKPGEYTAQDIIEYLDNLPYIRPFSFVDLEHPYFYTANSRLTLYADETRWAMVFEKSGYTPRGFRIELQLNYFGNCLENLTPVPIPNSSEFYNSQVLTLIDGDELMRIEVNEDNITVADKAALGISEENYDENEFLEFDESVRSGIEEIKLRGQYVKIPDMKHGYVKWVPDIMIRDHPKQIDFRDLARYLAYEYEELCRATDEELRSHIPHDLPKIMVIDEWHHKSYSIYNGSVLGDPPSSYETYRLIAEVLETKDPSRFKPTLSPNNHWINWPYAGAL
jgi:Homeodomain-like domain